MGLVEGQLKLIYFLSLSLQLLQVVRVYFLIKCLNIFSLSFPVLLDFLFLSTIKLQTFSELLRLFVQLIFCLLKMPLFSLQLFLKSPSLLFQLKIPLFCFPLQSAQLLDLGLIALFYTLHFLCVGSLSTRYEPVLVLNLLGEGFIHFRHLLYFFDIFSNCLSLSILRFLSLSVSLCLSPTLQDSALACVFVILLFVFVSFSVQLVEFFLNVIVFSQCQLQLTLQVQINFLQLLLSGLRIFYFSLHCFESFIELLLQLLFFGSLLSKAFTLLLVLFLIIGDLFSQFYDSLLIVFIFLLKEKKPLGLNFQCLFFLGQLRLKQIYPELIVCRFLRALSKFKLLLFMALSNQCDFRTVVFLNQSQVFCCSLFLVGDFDLEGLSHLFLQQLQLHLIIGLQFISAALTLAKFCIVSGSHFPLMLQLDGHQHELLQMRILALLHDLILLVQIMMKVLYFFQQGLMLGHLQLLPHPLALKLVVRQLEGGCRWARLQSYWLFYYLECLHVLAQLNSQSYYVYHTSILGQLIIYTMHKQKRQLTAKIVVIGDIGVGKSSITIRYVYDKFDLKQQSTLGAAFMEKTGSFACHNAKQENKQVVHHLKLQIWDTAGQEKYRAIAKLYYRDCRVAIMVYDVTRRESFESLRRWHQQLMKSAPKGTILIVVANKIDLLETLIDEVPVSAKEGQQFAREISAKYFEVSAKNRKGIEQLFNMITNLIGPIVQEQRKERGRQKISESYVQPSNKRKRKKCCSQ